MPSFSSFVIALGLIAGIQTKPVGRRAVQRFTVHGGPASYELYVPTNGTEVQTGSDVSVSIIDTYGYDLKSLCTLETPYTYALVDSVSPDGVTQVILGPPQPIISISCRSNLPIRAIRSTD